MKQRKARDRPPPDGDVIAQLRYFYRRNGYVRRQITRRVVKEGYRLYKKGDEIRLVAATQTELRLIRRLLVKAGFEPGRPFAKGRQQRLPLYGRAAVARFLALVGPRKRRGE